MYHKVNDTPANSVTVPVTLFDEQMTQLRELGYTAVSLDEVLAYYVDGVPLPPRAVLITFDDAYRDNLENAVPILVEHGYPAVLFAPIGYLDGSRPLPHDEHLADARRPQPYAAVERPRGARGARASASSRTGSATARSPTSSWTRLRARSRCRSSSSRRRSAGRCATFAYVKGSEAHYRLVHLSLLRQAGYELAFTSISGANGPSTDPLQLHRYNVEPYPERTFELVLAGACDLIAVKDTVAGTHARRWFNAALGTTTRSEGLRARHVRPGAPGRRTSRLLREAWGEGSMSGDEFDWWFDGNPAGSLRSVAVMDDRVVGVAAHSLYAMVLDGERADCELLRPRDDRPGGARAWDLRRAGAKARAVRRRRSGVRACSPSRARRRSRSSSARSAGRRSASCGSGPGRSRRALRARWRRRLEVDGDAAATWPNHVVRAPSTSTGATSTRRGIRGGRRGDGRLRRRLAGEAASRPDDLRRRRPRRAARRRAAACVRRAREARGLLRAAGARAAARVPRARLPADAADAPLHGQGARRPARRRPVGVALHARRHGLLLMRRLVFVTQQVDPGHPALAATVPKIRALAERVDEVVVLADRALSPACCRRTAACVTFAARHEGRARRALPGRARRGAARAAADRGRRAHVPDLRRARRAARAAARRPGPALVHALEADADAAWRPSACCDRGPQRRPPLVPARVDEGASRSATGSTSPSSPASSRAASTRPLARRSRSAATRARRVSTTIVRGCRARDRARARRAARGARAGADAAEREHRGELERLVAELGLATRVRLDPAVLRAEVPALLARADVLVNNMRAGRTGQGRVRGGGELPARVASNPVFDELLDGLARSLDSRATTRRSWRSASSGSRC